MNENDKLFLKRINDYANKTLYDIDPQKTPVSAQLERLKPIMANLAEEESVSLEDIFIRYMDLASEAAVEREKDFQEGLVCDN
ncbi:MAG: hypothetical protein FWC09_04140 [Lachnospiraceae bacterium]|nr:hypothetical protein [Lachnospiraceae bacterium]